MDTDWFTDRIAARKMSQRGLARLMGMDAGAMSLTLRGKRKLTLDEAAQMAVLLDVSTNDVLEHAGVHLSGDRRCKVIGYVNGDLSVSLEAEGIHDMIDAPPGMPASAAAIQARTAGTDFARIDGAYYFVINEHVPPTQAVGTMAVVAVKGNGLLLAHVYKGYKRGTYNLLNFRGTLTQNQELAWAMPVHWIKTVV